MMIAYSIGIHGQPYDKVFREFPSHLMYSIFEGVELNHNSQDKRPSIEAGSSFGSLNA